MNEFSIINCDRNICFICKEQIKLSENNQLFETFSGKSLNEIIGLIFNHILFDDTFFINKICSKCLEKIKFFDEFYTKATKIKDEIVNSYDSKNHFIEIEQLEIENAVDFNFESIEFEIINETSAKCEIETKTEDLSDGFKKIINKKGTKYDDSMFQRAGLEKNEQPVSPQIEAQKHLRKYYCDECQTEIKTLNNFLIHKANHKKQDYLIDNNNLTNKKYICFCGKIFLYKLSYTQHLKIHDNIRKYHCEFCEFKAFNSTHLQRHIRARHTKEKNHTCVYCGRKFGEKYNMNSHIKKQHFRKKYSI